VGVEVIFAVETVAFTAADAVELFITMFALGLMCGVVWFIVSGSR
jgi:hypothetical protein